MKIIRFELSLFGINTYLVFDPSTKECAIIDPGMSSERERAAVADFLSSNELKLTQIINTHLHIDHVIGNEWLKGRYAIPVKANLADLPLGERAAQQAAMFGLPFKIEPITIDIPLNDGDIIKIGKGELKVITTPGHSKGGIALYDAADGYLISGDSLFANSIGRTDLPGGDHRVLIESIKKKLLTLPKDTIVYPGHGPATTIGHELSSNPYLIV